MGSGLRKLLIGLLSLAAILAIYLVYARLSPTPEMEGTGGPGAGIYDSNMGGPSGDAGKVGDVTIEVVRQNKFDHRDRRTGRVDQEFGFEELVHRVEDVWEIRKPYLNIYQRSFMCYVKADSGQVEVESAVRNPTAKDATFTGNVVIHIVPTEGSKVTESFLYLDDVVFLSDKSQFSTAGPVTFRSEDANMVGKGLELVYNEQSERVELLRLMYLETLRYKSPKGQMAVKAITKSSAVAEESSKKAAIAPRGAGSAERADTAKSPPGAEALEGTEKAGEYYECTLLGNVKIESPEQVILAEREVVIGNILWLDSPVSEANAPDANESGVSGAVAAVGGKSEEAGSEDLGAKDLADGGADVSEASDPNGLSEEYVDVVVTCDGGVVFMPMDSTRVIAASDAAAMDSNELMAAEPNDERTRFRTRRIEYDAETGDAAASGMSELTFYTSEVLGSEPNRPGVPVRISSQESVTFLRKSNQAVFEGGCECRMPQRELPVEREAKLSCPRLTANLLPQGPAGKLSVEDVRADGPVELEFFVEEPNDPNRAEKGSRVVPVTITAQKGATFLPDANEVVFEEDCLWTMPYKGGEQGQNYTLSSPKLTVDLTKGRTKGRAMPDVHAAGPAELRFYVGDFGRGQDRPKELLPGVLTAKKEARFSASSKEVVFEGDCECQVVRRDPNFEERYVLSAPRITGDLPRDANERTPTGAGGIEHLRADGGLVTLAQVRTVGKKVLGGIMLECRRFDYEPKEQVFEATGPGKITLNNSQATEQKAEPNQVSLRKPCYAFLQNFDKLTYFPDANQIIADANSEGALLIDYIPLEKGKPAGHIIATARHLEVNLVKTPGGTFELATLLASKGITYHDRGGDNEFVGSRLFYDHKEGIVKVTGDATQPCNYNGMLVDGIEYDIKTGDVKAEGAGPGTIQLGPGTPQFKPAPRK